MPHCQLQCTFSYAGNSLLIHQVLLGICLAVGLFSRVLLKPGLPGFYPGLWPLKPENIGPGFTHTLAAAILALNPG